VNTTNIDPTVLQILNNVDAFYNTSWQHLIWYTSALIGVVGLLVPFLSQWFQRRSFDTEKTALRNELKSQLQMEVTGLKPSLEAIIKEQAALELKKLEDKINQTEKTLQEQIAFAMGGVFYLQGSTDLRAGLHTAAAVSFVRCAREELRSNHEAALQKALNRLQDECLNKMTTHDFEAAQPYFDFDKEIPELLDLLEKSNKRGQFTNYIQSIKAALSNAKKRPSPTQ
jgi:hypothetical protein